MRLQLPAAREATLPSPESGDNMLAMERHHYAVSAMGLNVLPCTLSASIALAGSLAAQNPTVVVLQPVLVSRDAPTTWHAESWLAIDPRDARNLVVAVMTLGDTNRTAVYASLDGGSNWSRAMTEAGVALADSTDDPALTFDQRGNAYFLTRAALMRLRRSADHGRTWDTGVSVPGTPHDRPWLAVDPDSGRILVISKLVTRVFDEQGDADVVALSISDDGARTLSGPRLLLPRAPAGRWLYAVGNIEASRGGVVATTVYQCDMPAPGADRVRCPVYALVSRTPGRSFLQPAEITVVEAFAGESPRFAGKSFGGGRLAIDRSDGRFAGRMYFAWQTIAAGRYQTFVSVSSDTGHTWGDAVRVNDDSTSANQTTAGIAVDGQGNVGVVWYDRRDDPGDLCFRPYFALSTDGGGTWSRNVALSNSSACAEDPDAPAAARRFVNGGDTVGIVGLPTGGFYVAWIGAVRNIWQLFASRIELRR